MLQILWLSGFASSGTFALWAPECFLRTLQRAHEYLHMRECYIAASSESFAKRSVLCPALSRYAHSASTTQRLISALQGTSDSIAASFGVGETLPAEGVQRLAAWRANRMCI